jgi:maleylacetate reductase
MSGRRDPPELRFVEELTAARVVFGAGTRDQVPAECERLGLRRVLLIGGGSAAGVLGELGAALGARCVGLFDDVAQHVPGDRADACVALAQEHRADSAVAVGGGSAIGFAKVLALRLGLPILAVPTTLAGSEMTPVHGLTSDGVKRTGSDPVVQPKVVVYDPELLMTLPAALLASSGMNALAHAVESLWLPTSTPYSEAVASAAISMLAASLPEATAPDASLAARSRSLVGAHLGSLALGATGTGLHHRVCHVLGGTFGLPHADVHSAVLPHVAALNLPHSSAAASALARSFPTSGSTPGAIFDLAQRIGAATSLSALGLAENDLRAVVDAVTASPPPNTRAVDHDELADALDAAWRGDRPADN